MGRENINTHVPAKGQVWEHVKTGQQFLIITISNEMALCALLDKENENAVTKQRVLIPVGKFKFMGNRGLAYIADRKGKLPTPGKEAGEYNPRNVLFGAL